MRRLLAVLFLLSAIVGCGKNSQNELEVTKGHNIFGPNDRQQVTNPTAFPYIAIGVLKSSRGSCTGSLVGESLVLTAAHCVSGNDGVVINDKYTFKIGITKNGDQYDSVDQAEALEIMTGGPRYSDVPKDWALIKISKPLGKTYGFFKVAAIEGTSDINNYGLTQAGFGVWNEDSNLLFAHVGCSVRSHTSRWDSWSESAALLMDCDMGQGDSGGPIFKGNVIYGVVVQAYCGQYCGKKILIEEGYVENYANIAVNGSQMIEDIITINAKLKNL